MAESSRQSNFLDDPVASPIEEILGELQNGRMVILVDDTNSPGSVDLVVAAQMATPTAINFMAKNGRGLVCLALTQEHVEQLGLEPMGDAEDGRAREAFTVSIEALDGVTTGISAADRARTIAVAIDAGRGRSNLVTPGHVFPMAAHPGGVLLHDGRAEAAVDLVRLAGLNSSAVLCAIINDAGDLASAGDLAELAAKHRLKIGSRADLVAYRRRHDRIVGHLAEMEFDSAWGGRWRMRTYRNCVTGSTHVAIVKGMIDPGAATLVRVHVLDEVADCFGAGGYLAGAMHAIASAGNGIILLVNCGRSAATGAGLELQRNLAAGAQILAELGVGPIALLVADGDDLDAIAELDLNVLGKSACPTLRPSVASATAQVPTSSATSSP